MILEDLRGMKKLRGFHSASGLHRLNDRHWLAKFSANFVDRRLLHG
jgi:hypothetical protein